MASTPAEVGQGYVVKVWIGSNVSRECRMTWLRS
jgi:hypothetical protein